MLVRAHYPRSPIRMLVVMAFIDFLGERFPPPPGKPVRSDCTTYDPAATGYGALQLRAE